MTFTSGAYLSGLRDALSHSHFRLPPMPKRNNAAPDEGRASEPLAKKKQKKTSSKDGDTRACADSDLPADETSGQVSAKTKGKKGKRKGSAAEASRAAPQEEGSVADDCTQAAAAGASGQVKKIPRSQVKDVPPALLYAAVRQFFEDVGRKKREAEACANASREKDAVDVPRPETPRATDGPSVDARSREDRSKSPASEVSSGPIAAPAATAVTRIDSVPRLALDIAGLSPSRDTVSVPLSALDTPPTTASSVLNTPSTTASSLHRAVPDPTSGDSSKHPCLGDSSPLASYAGAHRHLAMTEDGLNGMPLGYDTGSPYMYDNCRGVASWSPGNPRFVYPPGHRAPLYHPAAHPAYLYSGYMPDERDNNMHAYHGNGGSSFYDGGGFYDGDPNAAYGQW